jgi:hypothetical protein
MIYFVKMLFASFAAHCHRTDGSPEDTWESWELGNPMGTPWEPHGNPMGTPWEPGPTQFDLEWIGLIELIELIGLLRSEMI